MGARQLGDRSIDEQAVVFGRFVGEPSQAELEQFFYLDAADLCEIAERRGENNRPGFALQVGTLRFLGTFLSDPLDVPWSVVEMAPVGRCQLAQVRLAVIFIQPIGLI
ncbi:DUF4158 domain-containing protein [Arthrobacter sp. Sr24]